MAQIIVCITARVHCYAGISSANRFGVLEDMQDGEQDMTHGHDVQKASDAYPSLWGPTLGQQAHATATLVIDGSETGGPRSRQLACMCTSACTACG